MDYQKVVVVGGGVLGSQIGFQSAYKGFDVTFWLRSEASIGRAKPKIEKLYQTYIDELEAHKALIGKKEAPYARGLIDDFDTLTEEKIEEYKENAKRAFESIRYETDMEKAFDDADLVIESMAEITEQKKEFYEKAAEILPEKTVIATNSSTFLPSTFADVTGRPDRYLALHFANRIWRNNVAEVMGQPKTDQKYFEEVVCFAEKIGMIPLRVKKEQPGYLLNSLLVPLLHAAQALYANEVGSFEDIDKAWRLGTGAPLGPFQILDVVGLETAYNIQMANPQAKDPDTLEGKMAENLKSRIDAGKTGVAKGEGFYKY